MQLTRPITQDEIAAYRVAGVVCLREVLDLKTVNDLRRSIDDAIETSHQSSSFYDLSSVTRAAESDDTETLQSQSEGQHDISKIVEYVKESGKDLLLEQVGEGNGRFLLDTAVNTRNKAFRRLCTLGAIPQIAGALLESERVNFYGDQIFVKEPGTREKTAFHQDAPYFNITGDQCCVMWIPVDPVTSKHGGMRYVRGSHRKGLYAPNVFFAQTRLPGSEGEDLPDIESSMDKYDVVNFDVEPGDILVHHYRTWHGGGGNLSRYQVRRAASLRYCGDDIRFKQRPGTPKQLHHTHQLQNGEPLSAPDFPVVWKRKALVDVNAAEVCDS